MQKLSRKTILPTKDNDFAFWNLISNKEYSVKAATVQHTIETFGFVVEEAEVPGKFNPEKAMALNVPRGPRYSRLQRGESVTDANGNIVHSHQVVGKPMRGRKVAILGDTSNAKNILPLVQNADVRVAYIYFM